MELLNARRDMAPAPKRGGFKRKAAAAPKTAKAPRGTKRKSA